MKAFSDRNPGTIGIVSIVVIALILVATFYSEDLPVLSSGTAYTAEFGEVSGLRVSDEVRIAGVRVGKVTDVELAGDKVDVTFRVENAWLGDKSTVSIQIKTLLGQKYLAVDPAGTSALDSGKPIPRNRTLSPYDITDAFNGLGDTVGAIDTKQLAQSFDTISSALRDTPPEIKSTLNGLSKLSETIAGRDGQLNQLLTQTARVSGTLADRDRELQRLLGDGDTLLTELQARKNAISRLLTGTRNLSQQLQGLVADNTAQLRPALEKLDKVAAVLQQNQDNLGKSLQNLAPFYRVFTNTLSNGRWFDVYVCGLLPPNVNLGLVNVNPGGCVPPKANSGVAGGGR